MANSDSRPTNPLLILLGGALVCLLATLAGALRFDDPLYFFSDVKNHPGTLQGLLTAVNGFLLVSAATCLLLARQRIDLTAGVRRALLGFAGLLLFLAVDEVVMFHEWAAVVLTSLHFPAPLGIDRDVYIFAAYGLVGTACLVPMMAGLRRHHRARQLLFWMLGLAAASQALDFVPWDGLTPTQQSWVGPLEESFKSLAVLSVSLSSWLLLTDEQPVEAAPSQPAAGAADPAPVQKRRQTGAAHSKREF